MSRGPERGLTEALVAREFGAPHEERRAREAERVDLQRQVEIHLSKSSCKSQYPHKFVNLLRQLTLYISNSKG